MLQETLKEVNRILAIVVMEKELHIKAISGSGRNFIIKRIVEECD